jgi:hypothetical protein
MTEEVLASHFRYVFRGNEVMQDGVYVKARCIDFLQIFQLISSGGSSFGGSHSECAYPV